MSFILRHKTATLMFKEIPDSEFAPSDRADLKSLEKDVAFFNKNNALKKIADAVSTMLVVLNKQRQIVFANQMFSQAFCNSDNESILGLRPGEAVSCIRANITDDGCGTSEFCRSCGAVNAILESHFGKKSEKECRIITTSNDSLDLRITATPYYKRGTEYTIFAINDISHEKRRHTLERVFFHDVMNSAGGILGLSGILAETENPEEFNDIAQTINRAAENMVNEINAQRQLNAAERGDLIPDLLSASSSVILKEVADLYARNELFANKKIIIHEDSENLVVVTDPVILRRVIGNMLKNALEASNPGTTVTLSSKINFDSVRFMVHNDGFIQKHIQNQIFQRSFSTKGTGRGVGTYSMKLLGEKYLRGKVGFESSVEKGTIFYFDVERL